MWFTAVVEAKAFSDAEGEADQLQSALGQDTEDLRIKARYNDDSNLTLIELVFDAADAIDAHDQAVELWKRAWEQSWGESWPMVLSVRCTPGLPDESAHVGVAASSADPLADLDDGE